MNIRLMILTCGLALATFSCQKYLDIKPYGRTVPKTAEEFSALIHEHLNTIDQGDPNYLVGSAAVWNNWGGSMGDDFETSLTLPAGRSLPLYLGDLVGTSTAYSPYTDNYRVIRDCNLVLSGIQDRDTDEARKVIATAYALRAVAYYQLMRLYCPAPEEGNLDNQLGLPLVKEFDIEARPKRSTLRTLVNSIEDDLQASIALGNTDNLYRFTTEVCQGYLARLYFWTGQWDKAIATARPILANHPLLSGEDYKAMFVAKGELLGNQLLKAYRIVTSSLLSSDSYAMIQGRPISLRLLNLFPEEEQTTDIRYDLWTNQKRIIQKIYFCGLRSAELQLILSESLYHQGNTTEALTAINELRQARGVSSWTATTLPEIPSWEIIQTDATGKPITQLLSAILRERRKELFFEGDRFFELKRNGTPSYTVTYDGRAVTNLPYMYTFPLPPTDVQLSGLTQNPGYTDFIQ